MSVGMVAVFELVDQFEARVLSQAPVKLALSLLDWSYELVKKQLEYLRFFNYFPYDDRRKTDRLEIRNEYVSYYSKLMDNNLPDEVNCKIRQIIQELRSVPVGPYSSLLFVPEGLNHPPSELKKARERKWAVRALLREPCRADESYTETWDQNLRFIDFLKDLLDRRKPKATSSKPD